MDEHEPAAVGGDAVLADGHPIVRQPEQVAWSCRCARSGTRGDCRRRRSPGRGRHRARSGGRRTPVPASQHHGRHHVSGEVRVAQLERLAGPQVEPMQLDLAIDAPMVDEVAPVARDGRDVVVQRVAEAGARG